MGIDLSELVRKEKLLESSGYRYHFERMIYFNRAVRRAFSLEYVEDHSYEEIQKRLKRPATRNWVFHFNEPPWRRAKRALAEEFEK